jgi:methionine-rich copper-binding protein CopC
MKHFLVAAAVMLGGLAAVPGASAHALLRHASPPVGGSVTSAPSEAVLTFSEAVEPHFCTITVQDAAGTRDDTGQPHLVEGDGKRLAIALKPLAPSVYTVTWHATSVDTHRSEGTFNFTVQH